MATNAAVTSSLRGKHPDGRVIHPLWVRVTHWINALAMIVMIGSGWQIYNASPIFNFEFPEQVTLGGWLAGGIMWHFAAMWLLVVNGLIYLCINIGSGRLQRTLFPLSIRQLWKDFVATFRGKLSHDDLRHYNAVQKAAYLFAIVDIIVLV